jgi:hypothetical protein
MLIKLMYLVRKELTLTELKLYSMSREIGFADGARIIEFGFKVREAGLLYLVSDSLGPKLQIPCQNIESYQSA